VTQVAEFRSSRYYKNALVELTKLLQKFVAEVLSIVGVHLCVEDVLSVAESGPWHYFSVSIDPPLTTDHAWLVLLLRRTKCCSIKLPNAPVTETDNQLADGIYTKDCFGNFCCIYAVGGRPKLLLQAEEVSRTFVAVYMRAAV
jgi:hypothetical protein